MILLLLVGIAAHALEMDWSGQFWTELQAIGNYAPTGAYNPGAGSYYVPNGGSTTALFQNVFMRVRPRLLVNDNIFIKSEWWVGDPIYGLFGMSVPSTVDQQQYNSTGQRSSVLSAQRFWAEAVTDYGTIQVGKLPLSWGLGLIWNSGEELYSRYMSTGDGARLIAKYGELLVVPGVYVRSIGDSIGGGCALGVSGCVYGSSPRNLTDYSLAVTYANTDENFEVGFQAIKRIGTGAGSLLLPMSEVAGPMNLTTFDFTGKKKFGLWHLAVEVPFSSGTLGSMQVQAFGVASEVSWKMASGFDLKSKFGYASGQNNEVNAFHAMSFHPNYHIAMIMFNYQLSNFARGQNLASAALSSPYYNPIVNALYAAIAPVIKPSEKWSLRPAVIWAIAPTTAAATGSYYDYWSQTMKTNISGKTQGVALGFEVDFGVSYAWDDAVLFQWDNGFYLPGSFYAFSGTSGQNITRPVLASALRMGVTF